MSEDNKLKLTIEELKMIQDIIKRMADNSFKLKHWCIMVVVITIIFRANISNLIIPIIPLFAFAILDTYYLALERNFKILYDRKVEKFHQEKFDDIFSFKINTNFSIDDLCYTAQSKSIYLFYGGILLLILIAYFFE